MRRDPLGIHNDEEIFDLRTIEIDQVDYLEQALNELQEELSKVEAGGEDDDGDALRAKKESLETVLDGLSMTAATNSNNTDGNSNRNNNNNNVNNRNTNTGKSILPTDSNFDPILFLTLVHRKASYEELVGSMNRLSSKCLILLFFLSWSKRTENCAPMYQCFFFHHTALSSSSSNLHSNFFYFDHESLFYFTSIN